jgi:hypothetical protein
VVPRKIGVPVLKITISDELYLLNFVFKIKNIKAYKNIRQRKRKKVCWFLTAIQVSFTSLSFSAQTAVTKISFFIFRFIS